VTNPQSANRNCQRLAWQGWSLEVPGEWNPVRIEGGWRSGFVLLADLHKPRLGLRWGAVGGKRFSAAIWARSAMRDEIGVIAANEAKPLARESFESSIHYPEPEPPGRDVWVGFSPATGRGVELIYHAQQRDDVLATRIVPTVRDCPPDAPAPWSVFNLSCLAPRGMKLKSHQLNAGDLRLAFACGKTGRFASVRQIAVAKVALSRMPLAKWLADELRSRSLHYAAFAETSELEHQTTDGRALRGICRDLKRRWRSFFMRWIPRELVVAALHDESRDRLVLAQASSRDLLDEVVRSVGCAASR
jgi:hypothetical protein